MKQVIVSGLSGSGKSIALHTLEDVGFYCIDNLPVRLLEGFADELIRTRASKYRLTAVGIDARNEAEDLQLVLPLVERLRRNGIRCEIVFLDAEEDVLIRRFSETRRPHPLTKQHLALADAIRLERALLEPFSSIADLRIDTSHTNVHQLRALIRDRLADPAITRLSLLFQSFGYKNAVPRDADFVFDLRCLPNPYWHPELRPLTGLDPEIAAFLATQAEVQRMQADLIGFLEHWLSRFENGGRSYLTVAFGCTGGQHRSVYMANQMAQHFQAAGQRVLVRHRELS